MLAALLWNLLTVSYRQRLIPDVQRLIPDVLLSRVNSLYRFFGWGMMPIGALAGGWIVSLAELGLGREAALRLPFLVGATGCVALWVYGSDRQSGVEGKSVSERVDLGGRRTMTK